MSLPSLLLNLRRHRVYPMVLRLVLALLCLVFLVLMISIWQGTRYGSLGAVDFIEYWSAGQLLLQGQDPYNFESLLAIQKELGWPQDAPLVMWNPPWLLVWMLPVIVVNFQVAVLMWLGINLGIILFSATAICAMFTPEGRQPRVFLAWIAAILFAPALLTLGMGQASGLILLSVVAFLVLIRKRSDFWAGAALALTTVKPHVLFLFWIVVAYVVLRERRWKIPLGCASVLAVSAVILTFLRPEWLFDYLTALRSPPLYWATPTIGGVLRSLLGVSWSQAQYLAPALMSAGTVVYLGLRRPRIDWGQAASPLVLLSVVTMAYGWSFDQIVFLIPYLQILTWVAYGKNFSRSSLLLIFGGLIFYSASLLVMNLLQVDELHKFWLVFVMGACFLFTRAESTDNR